MIVPSLPGGFVSAGDNKLQPQPTPSEGETPDAYVGISEDSPVLPRLMPLYISSFFQGLIFWYAIEKIFMFHIGFTATTVAAAVILTSVVGLLVTIPFGILADRWSRKSVLIITVSLLGLASLLYSFAQSVPEYLAITVLFAMYPAVHYSVMDAMFYDALIGERNNRTGYEKFVGFSTSLYGIAMLLGSLVGGIIATKLGLSMAFLASLPSAILAIIALAFFKEPVATLPMRGRLPSNIRRNLMSLLGNSRTLRIVIALLFCNAITDLLLDMAQFWPIALHVRTLFFGPLNALLLLGYSLGGPLSSQLLKKRSYVLSASIIGFVASLLLTTRDILVIAASQFLLLCIFIALYTIALGKLHDNVPTTIRSSISSTMSMLCSAVYILFVYLFGYLVQLRSVFTAAWIILPVVLIGGLSLYRILTDSSGTPSPAPGTSDTPT